MNLEYHIADHESVGSIQKTLGIQKMPDGYALMLNPDRTHYYWLNSDGEESAIHWNRWAVRVWAYSHRGKKTTPQDGQ